MITYSHKSRATETENLNVRVSKTLMAKLKRHARHNEMGVSEYVRESLKQGLSDDNSEILSRSTKVLIKDDHLMTLISFVIGASLAQTISLTEREAEIAKMRADEFREVLNRYL